ncbi:MAG: hypothetical protein QXU69_03445 [Thermofilaceae archaeon]
MGAVAERFVAIAMGLLALGLVLPITFTLFNVASPSLPQVPLPPSNPFDYTGNPFQGVLSLGDWLWVTAQAAAWLGSTPGVLASALAALGVGPPWTTVVATLAAASMAFFAFYLIGRVVL